MLMFPGIVLLTAFPFFGALPEASAMPIDDPSIPFNLVEFTKLKKKSVTRKHPSAQRALKHYFFANIMRFAFTEPFFVLLSLNP